MMQTGSPSISTKAQTTGGGKRCAPDGDGKADAFLECHRTGSEELAIGRAALVRLQTDTDAFIETPEVFAVHEVLCRNRLALKIFLPAGLPQPPTAGSLAALALRQHG